MVLRASNRILIGTGVLLGGGRFDNEPTVYQRPGGVCIDASRSTPRRISGLSTRIIAQTVKICIDAQTVRHCPAGFNGPYAYALGINARRSARAGPGSETLAAAGCRA